MWSAALLFPQGPSSQGSHTFCHLALTFPSLFQVLGAQRVDCSVSGSPPLWGQRTQTSKSEFSLASAKCSRLMDPYFSSSCLAGGFWLLTLLPPRSARSMFRIHTSGPKKEIFFPTPPANIGRGRFGCGGKPGQSTDLNSPAPLTPIPTTNASLPFWKTHARHHLMCCLPAPACSLLRPGCFQSLVSRLEGFQSLHPRATMSFAKASASTAVMWPRCRGSYL